MRRWAAVLLTGCATLPAAKPELSACSLTTETACVLYGAQVTGAPTTPSGQLAIGLADRAAGLPDEDAVDYWRRVEEIVTESQQSHEIVNRRAAPSYASLAVLAVDGVSAGGSNLDEALSEGQAALERVRTLGEFAVRWGDAETQVRAARAIADAYGRQAENLAAVQMPAELSLTGRASLEQKRDTIVAALREEQRSLLEGIIEQCRRRSLSIGACSPTDQAE